MYGRWQDCGGWKFSHQSTHINLNLLLPLFYCCYKPPANKNNNRKRTPRPTMEKNRKRKSWKDAPSFLDATASVSVATFGGRRLPELKQLYWKSQQSNGVVTSNLPERGLTSGGGKRSSRHLRRRTTAFSKTHRHRYPEDLMRYQGKTRKSKRKKRKLLTDEHENWLVNTISGSQVTEIDGVSSSSSPVKWPVTHLWHAKRFHIGELFDGWRIPLVHANRGPRAAVRLSQSDDNDQQRYVLIQDVSWEHQPMILTAKITSEADLGNLLQNLSRVCPELIVPSAQNEIINNSLQPKALLYGLITKEGMLHELDQFPCQPVGPVSFRLFPDAAASSTNIQFRKWTIEIRCHPSIRKEVRKTLHELNERTDILEWDIESKFSSRICFRLYGTTSTAALNQVIKENGNNRPGGKSSKRKWSTVIQSIFSTDEQSLPHGAIIWIRSVSVKTQTVSTIELNIQKDPHQSNDNYIKNIMKEVDRWNPTKTIPDETDFLSSNDLMLVYQAPRSMDCTPNRAMSGWKVFCQNADLAKDLWMSLVASSNNENISCCAIGLLEECHLRLECEPPLPIFPRDFVDTYQSRIYWRNTSNEADKEKTPDESWSCVRKLFEGPWGRPNMDKISNNLINIPNVDFRSLVICDNDDDVTTDKQMETSDTTKDISRNRHIVVVRNVYCKPFANAIEGYCGSYDTESQSSEAGTRNKRRRKARRGDCIIKAPPLSKREQGSLYETCQQMILGLSLPAALLCHIQVVGKGRFSPGDDIIVNDKDILGNITASCFSTSRGAYHGLGIIGAADLLKYLALSTESSNNCGRVVRLVNQTKSFQLAVSVNKFEACLFIVQS